MTKFDDLEVGQTWDDYTYDLTPEAVSAYRESVRLGGEDDSGDVPPMLLDTLYPVKKSLQLPEGTLHAQESVTFLGRPAVGERVSVSLVVKEKFVKKERKFVVITQDCRASDGRLLATAEKTFVWAE
ncbi:hypothetical protein [Blastococcus saxobsidens]|uniref:hypothetical protein n=1 Tax=Blastococcus saxobsidens TaxID=138336 RepID=UPI00030ABBFC|nr:hypothetical protein [Blastococcus saxobsidens]